MKVINRSADNPIANIRAFEITLASSLLITDKAWRPVEKKCRRFSGMVWVEGQGHWRGAFYSISCRSALLQICGLKLVT